MPSGFHGIRKGMSWQQAVKTRLSGYGIVSLLPTKLDFMIQKSALTSVPSGQTMTVLSGHTLPSSSGIWPASGKNLLTSSLDSSLILWDPRSPTPVFKTSIFCPPNEPELDPAQHGITSLAVAPNGQIAAVGGSSGAVKVVNLTKGDVVGSFTGHAEGESVEALVFVDLLAGAGGGKGVVLVSGATDGKGFVWDVATGRVRAELSHDVSVCSRFFICSYEIYQIFAEGHESQRLIRQAIDQKAQADAQEPITSLAAHPAPNLHLVTSASADSTLKTWDIRTGALIAHHKGHAGVVNGVAVGPSPDGGQVIVSAGDEGVSLLWKV